jgi:hypothetical protein
VARENNSRISHDLKTLSTGQPTCADKKRQNSYGTGWVPALPPFVFSLNTWTVVFI